MTYARYLAVLSLAFFAAAGYASAAATDIGSAAALRAKHAELAAQLKQNQFERPLYLESAETPGSLKGDIYAVVDYPFASVNAAFNSPDTWCDVLILHINTKYCRVAAAAAGTALAVNIGKKNFQSLQDAYRLDFDYRVAAATADYLEVRLNADRGPLATSDYRIRLQVAPLGDGRTFLHLTYSYSYGVAGRLALQGYLATTGSGKVGFTVTGRRSDGQPEYIDGVRGVVERNTMRYYLAIDAYLSALATPAAEQFEQRIRTWFASTERYARQLHEMDRSSYLSMKRSEYLRQQTAQR